MSATMTQSVPQAAAPSRPRVWFTPWFDLWENEKEYWLLGDLPGVDPADLNLTCEKGVLKIHGKVGERNYNAPYFAEEFGVGDFHRSFTVGDLIDTSLIDAELKDGVLAIRMPKRPEARPRKINVRTG